MDHVIIDRETRVWMHNDRLSDDSSRGLRPRAREAHKHWLKANDGR